MARWKWGEKECGEYYRLGTWRMQQHCGEWSLYLGLDLLQLPQRPPVSPWRGAPARLTNSTQPFLCVSVLISWREPLFNSRKHLVRSLKPVD